MLIAENMFGWQLLPLVFLVGITQDAPCVFGFTTRTEHTHTHIHTTHKENKRKWGEILLLLRMIHETKINTDKQNYEKSNLQWFKVKLYEEIFAKRRNNDKVNFVWNGIVVIIIPSGALFIWCSWNWNSNTNNRLTCSICLKLRRIVIFCRAKGGTETDKINQCCH